VIARSAALSVEAYRVIAGADPTEAELCQVLATFEAALDRQPDDDWLLLASAWAQCRRLKYEEALELLRRGEEASRRRRDTGNPAITAAMAYVSARRGDLETARNQLRRAQTEARWPMWKDSREQATIDAYVQAANEAVGKLPPATVSGREPAGRTASPVDADPPTDRTHSTRPAGGGGSGG
jgi:tetratricopeptide (TPR) repeat protein